MNSKKHPNILSSFSFRLTVWFVGIFGFGLTVLLLLAYAGMHAHLLPAQEMVINQEAKEARFVYEQSGRAALLKHLHEEIDEFEIMKICLRLIDSEENIIAVAGISECDAASPRIFPKESDSTSSETLFIDGSHHFIRVLSFSLDQDLSLQGIVNVDEQMRHLALFRVALPLIGTAIILLAAGSGYWLARGAMKRVRAITALAQSVSNTNLEKRLPHTETGDEIAELTDTFNGMLDRIAVLVRSLKQVTDDLAHELRTPVSRIRTRAELTLSKDDVEPGARAIALNTIEECEGLLELINTVLDISEIEGGINPMHVKPVNVMELLKNILELFEPLAQERGVSLTLQCSAEQPVTDASRPRLEQVFSNILDNAIKYTDRDNSIVIEVSAEREFLKIEIRDTGIGIAEEHLPHLRKRFFRVSDSRSGEGYGLGLTIAHSIVQAHRGEMTIKSEIGRGTTVLVKLARSSSKGAKEEGAAPPR